MSIFVLIILAILALGIAAKKLGQPYVVGYLLVGIIIGPYMLGLVTNQETLSRLGFIGVLFLMFFTGMEVSPKSLASNWVVAIIGTFLQITVTVALVAVLGLLFRWPLERILLLGFVISLSSTAVVVKLLQDWQELNSRVGQAVLGVLLVQDLAVVPMLIALSVINGNHLSLYTIILQIIAGVVIIAISMVIIIKEHIHLPFIKKLAGTDQEMQVFAALTICFGMALLTGLADLSAALGAFVAGMIVASANETHWVNKSLASLHVIFIALFFVSIGMLIDLKFVWHHVLEVISLVLTALIINTSINTILLRVLGEKWENSLYSGALLSQLGEFGFVLALVGYHARIISADSYQMTIAIIAISLLCSPLWVAFVKYKASPYIRSRYALLN